uniref:Multidrug-efflux transporter n=1 Tax=Jahnella sp. MSr9139 TaxID=1434086 RepID=A0A3Q8I2B7_9BACT|nr:multidrug transport protein putative membrane protein [Jahnella sp. MSr9139]
MSTMPTSHAAAKHGPGEGQSRTRAILTLSLPVVGGMVSQNVLNLVDTAFVGSLGNAALAAVGTGSFAYFMCTALVTGISSGVQAMAARRLGEGREGDTAVPLNGGLALAIGLSIPLTVITYTLAPAIFPLLNKDPAVIAHGVPFLQVRLLSTMFLGCNFAFRGYWNGVRQPGRYFRALLLMNSVNIALCWLLIFGNLGAPRLGTYGAGLASTIATGVGMAYYAMEGFTYARKNGFLRGLPDAQTVRTMVRLAVPAGLQQLLFSAGLTALFVILGRVGTVELAAASVLTQIMLVVILPGIALGITATTLVGQALGRKEPEDAYRWGWDVVKVAAVVMAVMGLPMLLAPDPVLAIFIRDPQTLAVARPALRVFGATIATDGVGMVLLNALLGAGASRSVMLVSVSMQWLLFLPAAYLIGPVLGHGLLGIWIAQSAYRALQAGVFAGLWRSRRWARIEV